MWNAALLMTAELVLTALEQARPRADGYSPVYDVAVSG
jgi:hypothetical protein